MPCAPTRKVPRAITPDESPGYERRPRRAWRLKPRIGAVVTRPSSRPGPRFSENAGEDFDQLGAAVDALLVAVGDEGLEALGGEVEEVVPEVVAGLGGPIEAEDGRGTVLGRARLAGRWRRTAVRSRARAARSWRSRSSRAWTRLVGLGMPAGSAGSQSRPRTGRKVARAWARTRKVSSPGALVSSRRRSMRAARIGRGAGRGRGHRGRRGARAGLLPVALFQLVDALPGLGQERRPVALQAERLLHVGVELEQPAPDDGLVLVLGF